MSDTKLHFLQTELARRMKAQGYNRKSLSLAAGLNEVYVSNVLRGRVREPAVHKLQEIAFVLGCTVDALISKQEDASRVPPAATGGRMDTGVLVEATCHVERVVWAEGLALDSEAKGYAIARLYDYLKGHKAAGRDSRPEDYLIRTLIDAAVETSRLQALVRKNGVGTSGAAD